MIVMQTDAAITISVDAMGGSGAPRVVIEAIRNIIYENNNISFIIFGDRDVVPDLLQSYGIPVQRCDFVPTQAVISDDEKPVSALRNGKHSSMRKAIEAVQHKVAHACVSAGNTGALMIMAKMVLGSLSHIKRPAIVGSVPNVRGRSIMLDLGANTECNETMLFQFALMGACFAKSILKLENPSIGLLNIGIEEVKGREIEQKTYNLLKESGLNFMGYLEGHDITAGNVDVIVTDGFTGNIALKALEGTTHAIFELFRNAYLNSGLVAKLGALLLKNSLKKQFAKVMPEVNNGAMFGGVNGIVVKSHGSSNAVGMANAIKVAATLARHDINNLIIHELKSFEAKGIGLDIVSKIKHTSAKFLGINLDG
ncbi:Phosphate acyltransferase [Alphaproteobacteria bacterium]